MLPYGSSVAQSTVLPSLGTAWHLANPLKTSLRPLKRDNAIRMVGSRFRYRLRLILIFNFQFLIWKVSPDSCNSLKIIFNFQLTAVLLSFASERQVETPRRNQSFFHRNSRFSTKVIKLCVEDTISFKISQKRL